MAELPQVKYCILCDDVRFEQHNKISIMGMFGIVPDVRLLSLNLQMPLPRLEFLIILKSSEQKFEITFEIERPNKEKVKILKAPINIPAPQKNDLKESNGMLVIEITKFIPKEKGEFKIMLLANEQLFFQSSFLVDQGEPKDFS